MNCENMRIRPIANYELVKKFRLTTKTMKGAINIYCSKKNTNTIGIVIHRIGIQNSPMELSTRFNMKLSYKHFEDIYTKKFRTAFVKNNMPSKRALCPLAIRFIKYALFFIDKNAHTLFQNWKKEYIKAKGI